MVVITMQATKNEFYEIVKKYIKDNGNNFPWYNLMELDENENLPARIFIDDDGDMDLL